MRAFVCASSCDHQDVVVDVIDRGSRYSGGSICRTVFSPFFTTREKGTGLGLAIASRIMMTHRGSLEIHETSERGTCVRISLPIRPHWIAAQPNRGSQVEV